MDVALVVVLAAVLFGFYYWIGELFVTKKYIENRVHHRMDKMIFFVEEVGPLYQVSISFYMSLSLRVLIHKSDNRIDSYELYNPLKKINQRHPETDELIKRVIAHARDSAIPKYVDENSPKPCSTHQERVVAALNKKK